MKKNGNNLLLIASLFAAIEVVAGVAAFAVLFLGKNVLLAILTLTVSNISAICTYIILSTIATAAMQTEEIYEKLIKEEKDK